MQTFVKIGSVFVLPFSIVAVLPSDDGNGKSVLLMNDKTMVHVDGTPDEVTARLELHFAQHRGNQYFPAGPQIPAQLDEDYIEQQVRLAKIVRDRINQEDEPWKGGE